VVNKKETCYSTYCGDMAPTLQVMNARIVLTAPEGLREISIEKLFSGDGKVPLRLNPGEILTEIIIPQEAFDGHCIYLKFANRESIDFPIVGAAFWASKKKKEYRLAFTAVDRKPLRAQQVEAYLNGKKLVEKAVTEAAALASKEAKPLKTSVYAPTYKRRMMGLLLQSAANQTVRRSNQ
jgi:CO/xanthine dehydrogenase FAD-binding subunit